MNIPMNNGRLDAQREQIANQLVNKIVKALESESIVRVYRYQTPYSEDICRYVGKEFKKQGYYVALDFVPNGFRNLIISKTQIPNSSGRLVYMERL